jgi:hypothetical protein
MSIQQDLVQSRDLPPFPADLNLETLEFFDQHGVLCGQTPIGSFDTIRTAEQESDFIACYINGELAYYQENDQVLFNRLENLAIDFEGRM